MPRKYFCNTIGAKRTSGKNIDVGEVLEAVANASVLVELSNMTLGI